MAITPLPQPDPGRDSNVPSLATCAACGVFAYPGDRFCACCGAQLIQACSQCGVPLAHPVSNYCTACGAPAGEKE